MAEIDLSNPPETEIAPSGPDSRTLVNEIQRRRTFAIISHPDAGKTTLTEKLLLYSGCVGEAGAVRGRKTQRSARSDWMQLERERGISITSTVLSFEYDGKLLNLLDTPGHQDFSEDTYRTLTAVDAAVMVIDAVKGIEAQTRKLFAICAARKIPILTFVNKLDRPGSEPLKTLSEIEKVLGIDAVPLNWPIGVGRDFRGVYDRQARMLHVFETVPQGSSRVPTTTAKMDSVPEDLVDPLVVSQLRDDAELLDHAAVPFDRERFLKGEMTPVFFGSALTNFGVEFFLNSFLDLAPPPGPRLSDRGPVPSERPEFAGVVFKIQANLDPRHHDCVAFMRVCAGTFSRDMDAVLARTGERIRIKRSQRLFANQRETMEFAFPGDVVGLTLPGQLRLGDTLGASDRLQFVGQWQFPPECFATLSCTDTSRRKQFDKGLEQLVGEGAIQRLRDPHAPTQEPVLAAVGQLQFDVVQYRLEAEYNARTTVRHLPYRFARWVTGSSEDLAAIRIPTVARLYEDDTGHPVVVIETEGMLRYCQELNPKLTFAESRPIVTSAS